jgi:hypothetical protein
MRHVVRPLLLVLSSVIPVALAVLDGCGVSNHAIFECNPDAYVPDPSCLSDAGPDAEASGGEGGGPNIVFVPEDACMDRCVPGPSDDEGGFWSDTPLLLWVGPRDDVPKDCPLEAPYVKFRRFADLVAPPPSCGTCQCEASVGTCSELPTEMEARAGTCADSNALTLPFNGPAGWDGSCTDANAVPAGAACPPGSSTPCVQSLWTSPLPGPTFEACAPVEPVPHSDFESHWLTAGLACDADTLPQSCNPDTLFCVRDKPLPWLQCVWRAGIHEQCPSNYSWKHYWMYAEEPIDTRGCSDCQCGSPGGSACLATLRLYDDSVCNSEFATNPISSVDDWCAPVFPAGRALGGKAITDLSYLRGACAASGGEPTGEARPDPDPQTAITFCCLAPFEDHTEVPR